MICCRDLCAGLGCGQHNCSLRRWRDCSVSSKQPHLGRRRRLRRGHTAPEMQHPSCRPQREPHAGSTGVCRPHTGSLDSTAMSMPVAAADRSQLQWTSSPPKSGAWPAERRSCYPALRRPEKFAAAGTQDSSRQLSCMLQQAQRPCSFCCFLTRHRPNRRRRWACQVMAHMSTFFRHSSPSSPSAHDPRAADRPSQPGGQKRSCLANITYSRCRAVYKICNLQHIMHENLTCKSQSLLQWHEHRGCCQAKSSLPAIALSHRLPPASMVLVFVMKCNVLQACAATKLSRDPPVTLLLCSDYA